MSAGRQRLRLHRHAPSRLAIALLLVVAALLAADDGLAADQPVPLARYSSEPIHPVVHAVVREPAKVTLGERLFKEPRLSRNDTIACLSCHDLGAGGVDHRKLPVGVDGQIGAINTPTVFNSSLNFVQFWDGRATSLEQQAAGPITNPKEMDSNWDQLLAKLKADAGYRAEFARLYPDGITAANVTDAIAAFERTLVTPDSRFDRYLRGDAGALTDDEREGYRRFKDFGCVSCHQGVNIGGNLFQRFGVMHDPLAGKRPLTEADLGRYNVTRREEDRQVFKVPGLRNVALTAPYFHDGSAATLEDAVATMGRAQLGRELSIEDTRLVVAFLRSLTGQWNGKPLK